MLYGQKNRGPEVITILQVPGLVLAKELIKNIYIIGFMALICDRNSSPTPSIEVYRMASLT